MTIPAAEPVPPAAPRAWHAELAWLPGRAVCPDVLIEAAGDRFTAVTPEVPASDIPDGARPGLSRLPGLTLPGLANAHSHAFHRALRGITQVGRGTFWTWRERMYQVAAGLDPDSYLALARAVYAEMALAGITCVGEFHYLHHGPGGKPYADPERDGPGADRGGGPGRDPDHPAGHLLPVRRAQPGRFTPAAGRAPSSGSATVTARPGRPGPRRSAPTRTGCSARWRGPGRRSTRCGRCRRTRCTR